MFLKHVCNLTAFRYNWGWVISGDKQSSRLYSLSGRRSALRCITKSGRIPERDCSFSGCHLGLLSWQLKHSHQSFPQAANSSHLWLRHDLLSSPFWSVPGFCWAATRQLWIFLSLIYLQAPARFSSFTLGQLSPHHWSSGASAASPLLSGPNKASQACLPAV